MTGVRGLLTQSRIKAAGFAVLLTGFLVGGWGLAGVVAHGSTGTTAVQEYRVTVTKTIKVRGADGKVRTRVVRSVRIVRRPVIHDVTQSETVTTPGGTRIVTTRTTKVVPVVRVRNRVVTINGRPVTVSETITQMQTQTQTQTQAVTQTVSSTSTQVVDHTQVVTVTQTETAPPQTVTETAPPQTVTETNITTVVVTETTPAVTETVTGTTT